MRRSLFRSGLPGPAGLVVAMVAIWVSVGSGPAVAAGGTNLLKNGTFEGSGSGSLSGWSASNATLTLAGDGFGGGHAARVAASATGTYKLSTSSKPVKNAPLGEQFTANGMVRSDAPGKTVCLVITESDSSGATVASTQRCMATATTWTSFPGVDVAVADAGDSLSLSVRQAKGVGGDSFEADTLSIVDLDTTAPTVPTGLTASGASYTRVDLSWSPSSDPGSAGVTGYAIYRNGSAKPLATVSGSTTTYQDLSVSASTTYTYTVAAFDFAQNYSSQSAPASVTTPEGAFTPTSDVWHMDETSGTTMVDSTGRHPGTLDNVSLGRPGDPAHPGTAYGFDGVSSSVLVPDANDLNPYHGDVHIGLSLRTSTVPAQPDYDLFRKGQAPGQEYKVELQPNGQVSCDFRGSLSAWTIQAGPDLHDGHWHHIECVKLSTSVSLTVDGVTWTKQRTIGSISNHYNVELGAYPNGDWYEGDLDEVTFRTG